MQIGAAKVNQGRFKYANERLEWLNRPNNDPKFMQIYDNW